MGRFSDALGAADEVSTLAPPGSEAWGEAQCVGATALVAIGQSQQGDARALWALDPSFGSYSLSLRARLLSARVRGILDTGNPTLALQVAEQATAAARASGSADTLLHALQAELDAFIETGDLARAMAAGGALLERAELHGRVGAAARARLHIGQVMNHLGLFEEAHSLLERSLVDARAQRLHFYEAFALSQMGISYARLGHLDTAVELEQRAARIADEMQATTLRLRCRCFEALFRVARHQ